ncbi:MAG: hypothetical protein WBE83_14895 [Candidatus Cybelea sp.]
MKMLLSGILAVALLGSAPTPAPIIANNFPVAATTRDGSKDWAFEYGTWRTHYRLLVRRLAHSHTWYDCYGTSIVTPFWGGEGNLEDGDLKCPHRYIGGMALRMYNPRTRQWTIWWGTRRLAVSPPAQVGHFENTGVGRFYSYDNWQGTPIITRFQWSVPHGNPRFEQAFSTDGGKTWETNWTTDYTRVSSATPGVWNRPDKAQGVHGGFAFLAGTWNLHIKRLAHPLSGREDWVSCSGPSTDHQFWGGAGDFQEARITCGARTINALTLRLYYAASGRWLSYWATQANGLATGLPIVGTLDAHGNGKLTGPDVLNGKPILTRTRWSTPHKNPHLEQAYSADDGKTWETNWITDYTCAAARADCL